MAAEELALHPPVVITIVKPGEEETPVHYIIFVLTFYLKVLFRNRNRKTVEEAYSPYLVSSFDGPAGEEGYPGEA